MSFRSFWSLPVLAFITIVGGCDAFLVPSGPALHPPSPLISIASLTITNPKITVCGGNLGKWAMNLANPENQGDHLVVWIDNHPYNASQDLTDQEHCVVVYLLPNETPPSGKVTVFVASALNHVTLTNTADFTI